ncbi:putative telomeric repeat-binding factor 2-interacting protein 1-like [Apostichopus japonicus]|uniref:Telomeric repeat-binding factor 2-interacting protein 1 n=1 Tax=Stichopus japonicus TaxID=307972 RepID=A0A2G8KAW7_STIJA|nr:putative telomeric repeat-binding factor 2-interacting protein 1-like [Apostichopus japonicus]
MAADGSKESEPKFIFISDDGDALTFFIRPSETKSRLRPLIENAGGLVTSKARQGDDVIRIAADDDIATGDGYVQAQFVHDCLSQGQLLNTKDYLCKSHTRSPSPGETSNVLVNVTGTGRMKYTEEEDRAILQYIAKHPANYGGNVLWKRMELMKITAHSWQSMKDHFLSFLHDHLPEYVELERERQQEMRNSKRKRMTEEVNNPKRRRSNQKSLSKPVIADRQGIIYEFLKEMEDPVEDLDVEDSEDTDGIEKQLIEQIQFWCEKFSLSKKAIATALHINSGDLDRTEHLLEKKTLSPDTKIWSHDDDKLLLKGGSFVELCSKYGKESVVLRKVFLAGWHASPR